MKRKDVILNIIIIIFFGLILGYFYHLGPFYTTDTINYLQMASNVKNDLFPHSDCLSPVYPFLLGLMANFFSISLSSSLYLNTVILLIVSFFILHKLIKLAFINEDFKYLNSYFLTFIIISNWAILSIVLKAHADTLFLVVLLTFFYFVYLWIISKETKWFIISTIVGGLSIWVKLNGLVLLPFLIIAYIYENRRINYQYIIWPIAAMLFSFFSFKRINGTVINHLNGVKSFDKIIAAIENYKLLFLNISNSGNIFLSSIFSKTLISVLPLWVCTIFMAVSIFIFFRYYLFTKTIKKKENVFLLFSFTYWLFFISLQQYIGYQEISCRTLFPSILGLFLWLVFSFRAQNIKMLYPLSAIVVFNLLYSFYFATSLYKSDPENSFHSVVQFEKRKSINQLKKFQEIYKLNGGVYTNNYRSLYYALNFSKIYSVPTRKVLNRGQYTQLNESEFDSINSKFCKENLQKNNAVLLFDYPNLKKGDSCMITKNTRVYHIENDILLISLNDSLSLKKSKVEHKEI